MGCQTGEKELKEVFELPSYFVTQLLNPGESVIVKFVIKV